MIKVTVLMGGISSKREVSISSGKAVSEALKKGGYDVDEIQITDELLNPEKIKSEKIDESHKLTFECPEKLLKFIAVKGSVALNGTSLTVNEVSENLFTVNIIPHTKQVTTWKDSKTGDLFNLEIDLLARYMDRLQASRK